MIFFRRQRLNSKEFVDLQELILKLETKVKELSHAVTMLEIDLHNTRDKILKKIKPKDLPIEEKTADTKEKSIFLRPDGAPID